MPNRKRYLSIRGMPLPKNAQLKGYDDYRKTLKRFFKTHKICNECEGYGYLIDDEIYTHSGEGVNLNYGDIDELIELKEKEDINIGAKVRQILESIWWNRRPCKKCKGTGFTKK